MSDLATAVEFCLGDWVRDQYGRLGRVTQKHHFCPEDERWISMQSIPVTPEQRDGVWCSVLVHGGGSVVQPISTLTAADDPPATLNNVWSSFYFREVCDAMHE